MSDFKIIFVQHPEAIEKRMPYGNKRKYWDRGLVYAVNTHDDKINRNFPVFRLSDLKIVYEFLSERFPGGITIKDGRVYSIQLSKMADQVNRELMKKTREKPEIEVGEQISLIEEPEIKIGEQTELIAKAHQKMIVGEQISLIEEMENNPEIIKVDEDENSVSFYLKGVEKVWAEPLADDIDEAIKAGEKSKLEENKLKPTSMEDFMKQASSRENIFDKSK